MPEFLKAENEVYVEDAAYEKLPVEQADCVHVEHVFYKVIVGDVINIPVQKSPSYLQVNVHEIVISHDYNGLLKIVGVEIIAPNE